MTHHDSRGRDNAADAPKSGVSTHPHPDAYRFSAEEWLARNDTEWTAAHGALERLDDEEDDAA